MPAVSTLLPDTPDLFVRTAHGDWCPAYRLVSDLVDGADRVHVLVSHSDGRTEPVAPSRLDRLAEAGRVLGHSPLLGVAPVLAVVDDAPDAAPAGDVSADTSDSVTEGRR